MNCNASHLSVVTVIHLCIQVFLKGTHNTQFHLMLILSTYRVVLHPSYPSQPQTLPERVLCSSAAGWMKLSLQSMRARVCSSGRNAHNSRSHDRKKTLRNLYEPGRKIFETLSMLSIRIQLFNSVNNSECMKQLCEKGIWHPSEWL